MLEQPPRRCPQLRQNSLVPRNASQCSSSSAQGNCAQCGLRSFPSYTQPPGTPHISVVWRSTCEHGPAADALPVPCSPSAEPAHAKPHQGSFAAGHKAFSFDTSVSTRRGTCIPTSSGLNIVCCSWSLLLVTLSGPRGWRLLHFSGTVKLLESPGKAGGLPKGNYGIFHPASNFRNTKKNVMAIS